MRVNNHGVSGKLFYFCFGINGDLIFRFTNSRMVNKRFVYSWLTCSVIMYGASYAWHGLFLNDLYVLQYPLNIFLSAAIVAYLVIGFLITAAIHFLNQKRSSYLQDLKVGALAGAFIYLIAFVFGLSFHTTLELKSILFDGSWQIVEQSMGGLIGGYLFRVLYHLEMVEQS